MTLKFKMDNGVKVHDLEELTGADFLEAQAILESGRWTEHLDAQAAYRVRSGIPQIATYEVPIDNDADYIRFTQALQIGAPDILRVPTFQEWQDNRLEVSGRVYKLGKWLKAQGAAQEVVDFYSAQVRTGSETVYFTVSDMPQHIAGMSYYSDVFTSCMDTREDPHSIQLAGALHDTRLVVGMLHRDAQDVEDMSGMLLARVVFRAVSTPSGACHLIPARYYGSVETKDMMHRAIKKLQGVGIHSMDARWFSGGMLASECRPLRSLVDSLYSVRTSETVHIQESIQKGVEVPCSVCDENREYQVYSGACNKVFKIKCPACDGVGILTAVVSIEIDEFRDVEKVDFIHPPTDDSIHLGDAVIINVRESYWSEILDGERA